MLKQIFKKLALIVLVWIATSAMAGFQPCDSALAQAACPPGTCPHWICDASGCGWSCGPCDVTAATVEEQLQGGPPTTKDIDVIHGQQFDEFVSNSGFFVEEFPVDATVTMSTVPELRFMEGVFSAVDIQMDNMYEFFVPGTVYFNLSELERDLYRLGSLAIYYRENPNAERVLVGGAYNPNDGPQGRLYTSISQSGIYTLERAPEY